MEMIEPRMLKESIFLKILLEGTRGTGNIDLKIKKRKIWRQKRHFFS